MPSGRGLWIAVLEKDLGTQSEFLLKVLKAPSKDSNGAIRSLTFSSSPVVLSFPRAYSYSGKFYLGSEVYRALVSEEDMQNHSQHP